MISPESATQEQAPRKGLAGPCFFKNAVIFRLPPDCKPSSAELEEKLSARPLTECGPLDTERCGFVSATPLGRLVHTVNGQHLIAVGVHKKILPASVVRAETQKRAEVVAEEQGFPVGRKQLRELKEQVLTELLAKALIKTQITRAWIDTINGWLVVEGSGSSRAERLVSALREALGSFAATFVETETSPQHAMASWLRAGEAPLRLTLDSDLELQAIDSKATVKYARHALDGEDIRKHLNEGKSVIRLGLTFADRIAFVLTHKFELKKIAFLNLETEEAASESIEERFDADLLMMTADFAQLLSDLTKALGGVKGGDERV